MARRTNEFQTIRSEGGLLPPDLLRRVLDPKEKLPGTLAEDYGLPKGERINEVITQSWNRLRKHWAEFRAAAENLSESDPGTGLTNEKWNLPLLRELAFGLLPTSTGPEVGGRTYAISRFYGPVPVHLIGCGMSLDRRAAGVRGAAAVNPHGLVQEFLNRSPGHVWAILSNGLRFRILRDNHALSRQSFLEFDLEAMFAGEVYSDFVLLWLMAHATRFAPRGGDRPETCWLEQWTKVADEQGTRALGELQGGVERALQILGEGFVSHQKNTALREVLRTGQVQLADFHGQLLRVVYRLIFLFVAEDRILDGEPLLHPRDSSDDLATARERYSAHYSTDRLRELASKIKGSRHGDLWRQFQLLVGALSGDEVSAAVREHLALPALGSFLWDRGTTSALNNAELANHDFLEGLRHLAFTRQGKVLRPVDYKNLGAEELGGVYESLLSLTPQLSADGARFYFAEFAGNERRTSGSYYTPDSLVQCLLDSALDPVVEEAIKSKTATEAEKAILSLKICDPAVGSGHFLVGAAHRLARHLARVRALDQGESEPSPLLYQHALRDVIGHCLFGVDVNPMAAELCRVGLWLEALEPGRPLSFLDHHIRVGNSLLGTTPELIATGLLDDAFNAIEGDDKKICSALKKRNKQEREAGQQDMLHLMVAEREAEYSSIESRTRNIDQVPDDTIDEVQQKEEQFERLVVSPAYQHAQQVADAWCAAFVWKKQRGAAAEPITTDSIRRLISDSKALTPSQITEVERLSRQYHFFHWHLAFPEVFARGGFDCVLGNPPWEMVQVQELDFFGMDQNIAAQRTRADRERAISQLKTENPTRYQQWEDHCRYMEGQRHFMTNSGRYRLATIGRINSYKVMLEAGWAIIAHTGRLGMVVPSGIAFDDFSKDFFGTMTSKGSLVSLFDFENRAGLFEDVHSSLKFCLLTLQGVEHANVAAEYAFFLQTTEDLADGARRFTLTSDEIAFLNPNSRTCPIFRSRYDAILCTKIYRHLPVLVREDGSAPVRVWGVQFGRIFNLGHEGDAFTPIDVLSAEVVSHSGWLPLYEGKMFDGFNHRAGSVRYVRSNAVRPFQASDTSVTELMNPNYRITSQFYLGRDVLSQRLTGRWTGEWLIAVKNVTSATNERTVIAAVLPLVPTSYSVRVLLGETLPGPLAGVFTAQLNSFIYDWVIRQFLGGLNLQDSFTKQSPVLSPNMVAAPAAWDPARSITEWICRRVLELTYTAWDLEPFARDCGWSGPPFRWDEERRFLLRCELDAAFFHLYLPAEKSGDWRPAEGETAEDPAPLKTSFPTPRDAVAYIMDTFPIVKRKDEDKYSGDYRTKRVILEIYDAMQDSIRTGQPYQTRLDPPPADPRCCHPRLKVGILAYGSLITDPGQEISKKIAMRIKTQTPFPIEYGRLSQTRGEAPTLVPHPHGAPVSGEIFVLHDSVSSDEARDMLWRRERHKINSGEKYVEGTLANSVLVRTFTDHPCVATVHYTNFHPEGKLGQPSVSDLAKRAIESVKKAAPGKDGVSYLMDAMASGITTPLTTNYVAEILRRTNTQSLAEALKAARG